MTELLLHYTLRSVVFLRSRHVSAEQACFCGAGRFLRSRHVSMGQACFRGAGVFLRSRHLSTEQACFCGAGYFYGAVIFLRSMRIRYREKVNFNQLHFGENVSFNGVKGCLYL